MSEKKSWFTIENRADEKTAVINISGYIGMYEVNASALMQQVAAAGQFDKIEVHINSYGGEVFEGIAIFNWLKSQKATVETIIDSVAASTASFIFLAGSKRTVYDTSMGMIHLPTGMSYGTSEQMRKDADDLDKVDKNTIRRIYKSVVGDKLTDENIDEMMKDETWLDSDELVEYGFATDKIENKAEDKTTPYLNAAGGKNIDEYGFKKLPKNISDVFVNKVSAPLKPEHKSNQTEEGAMPEEVKVDAQKIADEARATERKRISDIRNLAAGMSVTGDIVNKMVNEGKGIVDALEEFTAAKKISAALPQNAAPVPPKTPDVKFISDDADKFRAGASAAMCMVSGMKISDKEKQDVLASEMPRTLHGLLNATLIRSGMSPTRVANLSSVDRARASLDVARNAAGTGTGDLTNVLADTINKYLENGSQMAPVTFDKWVPTVNANDYKTVSFVKMSNFGDLDTIPEGFPFQQGAMSDKKEQGAVVVVGKSLTITMQALVNDDLGAITGTPQRMGARFKVEQNKRLYDTLFGTAAVGPTLLEADSNGGYNAFSTYRGNFATGAGVPSVTTLQAGRKALMNQTYIKAKSSDTAIRMGLTPQFIITGSTQMSNVENVLRTPTIPDTTGSLTWNAFGPNGSVSLIPIFDAYLDSLSTTVWYLAANQAVERTMVMLALNGQLAPTVRSEESRVGEALGINFDVYGAYAPMMVDYRGIYCHKGA